jgi:N-acetylglucosamine-6-phosphate deacetylase
MTRALLLRGCSIVSGETYLERGDLLVVGGRIRSFGSRLPASGARVVRAGGLLAAPGLIDTQLNGGFGVSFSSAAPEQVLDVSKRLLGLGVTAYLPTLISRPKAATLRGIRSLVAASRLEGGARILGIHLEGPFLSPRRNGAHPPRNLRRPSLGEFREYHRASKGLLRMMTLAPELPGALEVIRDGSRKGVIMSAGHSEASAAEIGRAVIQGGLRHVTHVFNAMAPLHHRQESILNAALVIDQLSCGLIYDRDHVAAGCAALLMRAKPAGKVVLVSDAVAAMGLPDGPLRTDGQDVVVRDGRVTVKSNGRLAGSATSLLEGVRRLVEDTGLPPHAALAMATRAPARLLGLEGKIGTLEPGARADVVLFRRGLHVEKVLVGGEWRHGNHH